MTKTNSPTEKAVAKFLATWFNLFLASFIGMFVVGGIHDHADSRFPDLGYWGVFFSLWALAIAGRVARKGFIPDDTND